MSEPSTTPSLTPPTPTPRSEALDPMDKVAQRQISGTSYPQSGSPLREDNDRIDGAGMEIDERSHTVRQSLTLLPPSNHLHHQPGSNEVSPTTTTGNINLSVPIDPSLTANPVSVDNVNSGEQRQPLTGPTRTHPKPAPLNLRSISNSSTLQTPGASVGPGNEAGSPYAGQYAQRLERRASQYPGQAGHNQTPINGANSPQPQTQQASGPADEAMRYPGSDRQPTRPAILAHSASLPVLPSQDPATSSPSIYASQPYQAIQASNSGHNYARAYSYGYSQGGEPGASTYPGSGHEGHAQPPPPFPHAYSSPAVPMYPPGSHAHHYSPSGYAHIPPGYAPHLQHHHAPGYQSYPAQQHYQGPGAPGAMPGQSFLGSGAAGGYSGPQSNSATGNTPGVLVIGANGQIMPHNAAQMVGGRGTPLSERPFKCDECVQSFNRNHDLKRHKRIHLAVKPFACEKCGKQFSRKDALRRHWLVKGCKASDDPNVNMANPAYQASKTSSASPSNTAPSSMPPHHHHMPQPTAQHTYGNHPSMLRTPSYGGGPMVVTPDDESFGGYNNGYGIHAQFRQPMQPNTMSANTSPASTRPSGGSIGYGAPPARPYGRVSTPGSATFPGQLDPVTTTNTISDPATSGPSSKLPGRYSLDARLHTTASPGLERTDLGTRAASVSMPLTEGNHKRTHGPVMVVQADGMIEETVPGQTNSVKRISRDDYFGGVFHGSSNGSGAMDHALDAYPTMPPATTPKSASAMSPSFAMPFDKSSRQSVDASNNNGPGSEAWTRWHRPSFPFPHAGNSVYRAPDSMEDSTDLRKSISHRASVSQQQSQQQGTYGNGTSNIHRPSPPHGQRWTRASFPFPENPDNGMGIRSGDKNQQ